MAKKIQYTDILAESLMADLKQKFDLLGQASADAFINAIKSKLKGVNISDSISSKGLKEQASTTVEIENAKKSIAELTAMEKERLRLIKEYETLTAKLNSGTSQEAINNEKLKVAITEQNTERKRQAQLAKEAVGSYRQTSIELNKNIEAYKKLSKEQRENAIIGGKLLTTIKGQQTQLKAMDASMGNFQRNVGNYRSALDGLPGPIGRISSQTGMLVRSIGSLGPVGASVAAVLAALAAPLIAFFTKAEDGAELMERKLAGMKASWNVLVGELIKGGRSMSESFNQPIEQTSFWTKLMASMASAAPAFAARLAEIGIKMDAANVAAQKYTKTLQELEDLERGMIVPRAEANKQIVAARLLSQDETKSVKERINSLKEALNLEAITANNELGHQQRVIDNLIKINNEKKKAGQLRDEDDKKLQEAYAKQIELQTESMSRSRRAISALRSAENEEISKEISLTGDLTDVWLKLEDQIAAANRIGLTDRAAQLRTEQLAVERLQNSYNDFQGALDRFDNSRQGTGAGTFTSGTEAENLQKVLTFTSGSARVEAFEPTQAQKNLEGVNAELKEMNDNLGFLAQNTTDLNVDAVNDDLKDLTKGTKDYNKELLDLYNAVQNLQAASFDLFNAMNDAALNNAEIEVNAANDKIDALKSALDEERKLKDDGKANDYDRLASQLGDEQKLRDDAQKKYEKYQKRQAQLAFLQTQANLGLSVSQAFVEGSKTGPYGFIIAIAAAASLIAAFINMQNQIKSIGQGYAEGTEYVTGPGTRKSDSIHTRLSVGERVVDADTNDKLKGIPNDKLPELADLYRLNFSHIPGNVQIYNSQAEVVAELRKSREINEKMLEHQKNMVQAVELGNGEVMLIRDRFNVQIIRKV